PVAARKGRRLLEVGMDHGRVTIDAHGHPLEAVALTAHQLERRVDVLALVRGLALRARADQDEVVGKDGLERGRIGELPAPSALVPHLDKLLLDQRVGELLGRSHGETTRVMGAGATCQTLPVVPSWY